MRRQESGVSVNQGSNSRVEGKKSARFGISMTLRLVAVIVTALIGMTAAISNSHAHSPYWAGPGFDVVLPDGSKGRLELLFGDGILAADPAKALIIDAHGKVVAATPAMTIPYASCPADPGPIEECTILDATEWMVYSPNPATFSQQATINSKEAPGYYPEDIANGGFHARSAGRFEYLSYELVDISQKIVAIVVFAAIAAFLITILSCPFWIASKRKLRQPDLRFLIAATIAAAVIFVVPASYLVSMGDASAVKVLFTFCLSILVSWIFYRGILFPLQKGPAS